MKYGLKPKKYDPMDKHFKSRKILGATGFIPDTYIADIGLTMPDQNADSAFTECSGYLITDSAYDEDGIEYTPDYVFMKSLEIAGLPITSQGVDLYSAYKVPITFGLLEKAKAPFTTSQKGQVFTADQKNWPISLDTEAVKKKRPAILNVEGPNYFQNIRNAMYLAKDEHRTVGMGITWYADFGLNIKDGLLPDNPTWKAGGHAIKVGGWTTKNSKGDLIRNGEVFLMIKSWQGRNCGDNGWLYMSETLTNKLMKQWGADARMLKKVSDGTIEELKGQKINLIEVLVAYMKNLYLALTHSNV